MRLLLDLDGVCADFIRAICQEHGKEYPFDDSTNLGCYDLCEIWGITSEELLAPTNNVEWWQNVSPMEDLGFILDLCFKYFKPKDICILSKPPTYAPYAMVGKWKWCENYLPTIPNRLFGNVKGFCASPDTVLLDDDDFKVDMFKMDGGRAILMPRPWNSQFDDSDDLRIVEAAFQAMFITKTSDYE